MKEEKNILNYTQKDFITFIKQQRDEYALEEYMNLEENLINRVKRTLDLRDLMKSTRANLRKTGKIINKYAKHYKKEIDVKKLIEKQQEQINKIESRYVSSIVDLMLILIQILTSELFKRKLEEEKLLYDFEVRDLVLVNGIIKVLKYEDSFSVNIDTITKALYYAIEEYVFFIQEGIDYRENFNNNFMFVYFPEINE